MVSIRVYFTILILICVVFVMFMFVGVSSNMLSDPTKSQSSGSVDINYSDTLTAASLNLNADLSQSQETGQTVTDRDKKLHVAIISGSDEALTTILIEWCVYNKYLYQVYYDLPDPEEVKVYGLLLFGDVIPSPADTIRLAAYADLGITMIFTRLPDYIMLSENKNLATFYGISTPVEARITAQGIKIFSDFMMNKERIYHAGDYFGMTDDTAIEVPYYLLDSGYEVYAVGLLDQQAELGIADKDLPPLLWRNVTGNSLVFVINSNLFDGVSLPGILTGFMAHAFDCYLYPIVNAQTISLLNYPYFSDENDETMKKVYSRNTAGVARDLLWPNIVQILKNYGTSYNFFAAPRLDYLNTSIQENDSLDFYLREIEKLPGDMGLSLDQISGTTLEEKLLEDSLYFQKYLPDYNFSALYAGEFDLNQVKSNLNHPFLKKVGLVLSEYKDGDPLIEFLNNQVLSVKFTLNGYRHETMDDLRLICIENALGMSNVKVDFKNVFFPEDSADEWNQLSLMWSRGDTYFNDYAALDKVSISEMEKRIRRYLALDYSYENNKNKIALRIDHFDQEAYFILFTYHKRIDHIENGSATEISDTAFLIKATAPDVTIHLKEMNFLEKPRNNKMIPSVVSAPEEADTKNLN